MSEQVHVRPAWGIDSAPLSDRAAELLVAEWRSLGLVDPVEADESDPQDVVQGMQERRASPMALGSLPRTTATRSALQLTAEQEAGPAADPSAWPSLLGRLLTYGETAIIGRERNGAWIREQFNPGAIEMPSSGQVHINQGHDRTRVIGHVTDISTVGDEVRGKGIIVDTTTDGRNTFELARAQSVTSLSIEFIPLGAKHSTTTEQPDGGRLIRHHKVLLTGLAVVPAGAYGSARLLRLLDRAEAGRQAHLERDRARKTSVARLKGLTA